MTNENDDFNLEKDFVGIAVLLELLNKHEIFLCHAERRHNYQLWLTVKNSQGERGTFFLSHNKSLVLTNADCPRAEAKLPASIENVLCDVFDEFKIGNRLKKGHRFVKREIQSDRPQEGRGGLLSQEKRTLKKLKRMSNSRGSGSGMFSEEDEFDPQRKKGEQVICDHLLDKLREEFSEAKDVGWIGDRYQFSINDEVVAELVWDERETKCEKDRKNTPGYDILVIRNGTSMFHEVKTDRNELSLEQRRKAVEVGKDHYKWWNVCTKTWNFGEQVYDESQCKSTIEEYEVAHLVTREQDGQTVVDHQLETNQKNHSEWFWGTGRRKRAVARVRIKPGSGVLEINRRTLANYFTELKYHQDIQEVCKKTSTMKSIDIYVNVQGGGQTGQAGAIVLGLGRALKQFDPTLEPILRENGYLTRDPRQVERKKPGQPGARKRFQFSKR